METRTHSPGEGKVSGGGNDSVVEMGVVLIVTEVDFEGKFASVSSEVGAMFVFDSFMVHDWLCFDRDKISVK